ncbi:hypothetical protein APR11_004764 [Nocardia amikacinitolerans]|uniref:hypothetical protein n=1 Tax=Nocardia amikacinitolerans TaxID=756689 RepID=UPI0020A29E9B|nr:hypothetical protein [Nocardia amikacinitolerans]MCP2298319.1 hypothetical protein [Nocardia amikacinitolerans]
MPQFDNLPEPAVTTAGESIGAHRSEDAKQNNVEITVDRAAGDRTVIRLSPRNARSLAWQLNEVADALDAEYPDVEKR